MCGRYEFSATPARLRDHFGPLVPEQNWAQLTAVPAYNVAPSHNCLVIRERKGSNAIELMVWGFRPHWAKKSWINARAETVFTTPTFRESAKRRRCLVIATGWYEWQGTGAPKQPYYLHFGEDRVFAFAGIWTARKVEAGWEISFAILTTGADGVARDIHPRMPLVLHPRYYADWVDPETDDPSALLTPFDDGTLEAYPVSTFVNDPKNDSPRCRSRLSS